ncbi:MAG: MFS transporter [Deinococcota bacterium]|jgi:FSR family fosmidomycin resistance protein-like MFS transporter|nr:MFS transporter [Deinococcota bacterium]
MAVTASARRTFLTGSSLTAFLTFTHTTNDSFTSMLAALLPTLQSRFALTETVLALLVAVLAFSSSVTQPFFGAVADRLGRRLVGSLGVIMSSCLLSLMGVAPTVWLLFGLLLVGGLGSAAFHPSGTSMVRTAGGEKNKSLTVAIFSGGGTLGLALGPVVTLFIVANYGLEFTPWLMLPGLVLGVMMYLIVPPQERAAKDKRPKLFDPGLFVGPVGILCLSGILRSMSWVTFTAAMPLWLVSSYGIARDAPLIGWTLAAFSIGAGIGGILSGMFGWRLGRQFLITGTMLLAMPAVFLLFLLPPGSSLYFAAVFVAGALVNGGLPLMIVSAQDLAPHAMATASGMLMGFTWGTAGVLYIGIGRLQESIGLTGAMSLSYLMMIPGAALAFYVLKKYRLN